MRSAYRSPLPVTPLWILCFFCSIFGVRRAAPLWFVFFRFCYGVRRASPLWILSFPFWNAAKIAALFCWPTKTLCCGKERKAAILAALHIRSQKRQKESKAAMLAALHIRI